MVFRRFAVFLGCLILCAGCSMLPVATGSVTSRDTLDTFTLEGRFSLRQEDKSYSGRLSWRHAGADNEVLLSSPFGQGMAEIATGENGARLTMSDGKVYRASDVETLTKEVLGYPLPLRQLVDWVRGRATAGAVEADTFGRLLRLRHEGWSVDYAYANDDPLAPPERIIAERGGEFELRLRIDEWSSVVSGENRP